MASSDSPTTINTGEILKEVYSQAEICLPHLATDEDRVTVVSRSSIVVNSEANLIRESVDQGAGTEYRDSVGQDVCTENSMYKLNVTNYDNSKPSEKSPTINHQLATTGKIKIEINEAVPVNPIIFYEQNLKERLLVRAEPVQKFLKELAKKESFSIAGFKRTMHSMWKINNADIALTIDYQSPSAMFDGKLFIAGRTNAESNLNTVEMSRLHCTHCKI